MKKLSVFMALCLAASAWARPETLLDKKDIHLGRLAQQRGVGAHELVLVRRTRQTPKKVDVTATFSELRNECVEWDTRRRWVPGWIQNRTYAKGQTHYHNGILHYKPKHPHLHKIHHPGHWTTERYCVRRQNVPYARTKKLRLSFKKALKLAAGEEEVFELKLTQKSAFNNSFDLSAVVLETRSGVSYEIERGMIKNNTLKFKAKK